MLNLYADAGTFARRYVNDATLDAGDQTEMLAVLEGVSRAIDDYCDRHFFAITATRVFPGDGYSSMWIPDLISATSVKLDEDEDGTFETTLTTASYRLVRPGHYDADGTPKTKIELRPNGAVGTFQATPRLLEIAGIWGYTNATVIPAATLTENLDTSEVGVDVSGGTLFEIGQTILIDSEQMYVSGIATNTLTVTRGVNGTTAAAHTDTDQIIQRYVYVPSVTEAAIIQAGRMWKRRETAYANVIQNPLTGGMEQYKGLDPDVKMMLDPLRRMVLV